MVEDNQPLRLAISLADGRDYELELPGDHPAVAELLAWSTDRHADATTAPKVFQIPMDAGASALTFSPHHLVRLEVHGLRDVEELLSPRERSSQCPGHDPFTNVEEGHLGGYVRAIPTPMLDTTAGPHGDDATWYPLLWQWLVEERGVRSMLDIGCGEGHAAGFFRDAGCEVLGVDGSVIARQESAIPGRHTVHDFVNGPFVPNRSFDLVWSCEFVEHVEEHFTHNFLAAFASSRKYLLMTFAPPGQAGWHHVNCQEQGYWNDKLRRIGFDLDQAATERARDLAGHGHFMRRGLMFVRREKRNDASFVPGADPRSVVASQQKARGLEIVVPADAGIQAPSPPPHLGTRFRGYDGDRISPLSVNSMQVAQLSQGSFYLFHDIFVHATSPKIVAVCSYYGDDWNPAEHGVDYDAVDLVADGKRFRGRCLRHRLDSWEPCMLLEFESPELATVIEATEEMTFTIETGKHSRTFTIATRPPPAFDVAMSLVVRDENRWVRTFLQYYLRCLEAQHVFVYDNGTSDRDTLLAILEPYLRRGEATYIPWDFRWRNHSDRKMTAQPAQEAHSLNRFANCRWIGFFDVDELLRLPYATAPTFLERFAAARVDGLSFGIRWFSYRGPLSFEEADHPPLTYLYARRDNLGRKRQKFFVKGGTSRFLRLHWLEEGRYELPIDDSEIFFHHYEQHPERFEQGKNQRGERDDYMLRFHHHLISTPKRSAPATAQEWIEHIEGALAAAEQCRSQLAEEALAVDGMCGQYNRHFYNNLCNFAGCRYLEIGSYHGASTCAALYANDVAAVCIDNWSEFRGRRGRFEDAVSRFRGNSTVQVIEEDCFEVDTGALGPFDVFLYDGNHSRQSQYLALERFTETLADHAVVIIDDWNRESVRQGTRDAIRDLKLDIVFDKEIIPPSEDTADQNREVGARGWWNGLYVMLIRTNNGRE